MPFSLSTPACKDKSQKLHYSDSFCSSTHASKLVTEAQNNCGGELKNNFLLRNTKGSLYFALLRRLKINSYVAEITL